MTAPPPGLHGRFKHDPLMVLATGVLKAWFPVWGLMSRSHEVEPVNRVKRLRLTGREVVAEDEDVVAFTFADPTGAELEPWFPGAHLDVLLPSGLMREYSLCGDPADRMTYRIAVRRIPDGGGGSKEMHDALTVGELVGIKGPRNAFPLAMPGYGSDAKHLRFVAAGIGITPILPMLAAADRVGLDWSMLYSGRSLESIPFRDEVAAYGDRITIRTDDVHGLPTAAELLGPLAPDTAVYACGPVPMLESIRRELVGRSDVELHYERFSPPPVEDGKPFTITLKSGETIDVAADETALSALLKSRPHTPYSCRQGFCGTCRVRVTEGEIDHRDSLLTEPERAAGTMLACISRAAGDHLTVDL
jgi:ferredoxin-NADP reductase